MGALCIGCAAPMQNCGKVSLGMTPDQVVPVAGQPHKKYRMESAGQGAMIPTPAGTSETWFYKGGLIQFHDGQVVAKGEKMP
jgi:hypothetical protein